MLQRIPTLMLAGSIILACFGAGPALAEETSNNNMLVGYWNFDGDIKDASGHNLDGSVEGGSYIQGLAGSALLLDGRTNQVTIPHNDLLNLTTYSVTMWARNDAVTPYATLLRKGTDEKENYKLTVKYGNRPMAYMMGRDQKLQALVSKESPIHQYQWHFIAMTFDGQSWKIYVDAKEVFSATVPAGMMPQFNKEPILIGNENNIYNRGFKGAIDEVKLYNYAMTKAELEDEYKKLLPEPSRANLIVHYDFEGGAKDLQKSGIDGVVKKVTFKSGKVGRGADFLGRDEYIEVPYSKRLDLDNFSVELWANLRQHKENNYLYSKGVPGQENFELKVGTRGELSGFIKFQDGTRSWFRTESGIIEPGKWYHIVQTFESNVYRIYVDNKMVYERVLFGKKLPFKKESPLLIGKKTILKVATFDGMIDEFRVYNRALQPHEVANLRGQGTTNVIETKKEELVGKWSFEDTMEDRSLKDNDGKSPFTEYGPGQIGNAAIFDNRSDGIRVTDNNSLDLDEMSIAFWTKQNVYLNGRNIFTKGSGTNMNYAMQTRADGGLNAIITFIDGTTETLKSAPNVIQANTWHHVAMTYQPGSWKIIVDGKIVGFSDTINGIPQVNATDLFIGNGSYLGQSHYQGAIDEFAIYNYAISNDMLKSLLQGQVEEKAAAEGVLLGADGQTLLKNGNFESGLKDWTSGGQINEVVTDPTLGGKYVRLKYAAATGNVLRQELGKLEVGKTYKVSVLFRARPGVQAQLVFGDSFGADPLDNVESLYMEGNNLWKRMEVTHTMSHTDLMSIGLYVNPVSGKVGDEVMFDDVTIEEVK